MPVFSQQKDMLDYLSKHGGMVKGRPLNYPYRLWAAYQHNITNTVPIIGYTTGKNTYPMFWFDSGDMMHLFYSSLDRKPSVKNVLRDVGMYAVAGRITTMPGVYRGTIYMTGTPIVYDLNSNLVVHMRTGEVVSGDIAEPIPKASHYEVDVKRRREYLDALRAIRLLLRVMDKVDPVTSVVSSSSLNHRYYIGRLQTMADQIPISVLVKSFEQKLVMPELLTFCEQFYAYLPCSREEVFKTLLKYKSVQLRRALKVLV